LAANKAHHPKQTEQIPAGQGSKCTESITSLELLTIDVPFFFFTFFFSSRKAQVI
jgi:hypothetical protein